jgi:hypothetical protein
VNEVLRSMREAWLYRAALRRRVVRRDRPSPSETLWRLAPPAAAPTLAELLPPEPASFPATRVAAVAQISNATPPCAVAAELVRMAALASVERLTGRAIPAAA